MPPAKKAFTPEEAGRLIPRIEERLRKMRDLREAIAREKDRYDVEEMSSYGTEGERAASARRNLEEGRKAIADYEREFEKELRAFSRWGAELRSVDPAHVDFFSRLEGKEVFLCWTEGETEIRFWHDGGGDESERRPIR